MPAGRKTNAAKARAANLAKVNAVRKASAGSAQTEQVEQEQDQPPKKKQKTELPQAASQSQVATQPQVASQLQVVSQPPSRASTSGQPLALPDGVQANNTEVIAAGTSTSTPATTDTGMPTNGSFCIYATSLPFLQSALVPDAKSGKKDYAALFTKLKELQAKPDRTGQCYVHFPSGGVNGNGYGRFSSGSYGFTEPMGDEPYDIGIAGLKQAGRDTLKGAAVLATSDCGIASAQGEFTMQTVPMWKSGDKEIYEGRVEFRVKYGMYARKGHGSGTSESFAFWAIRSREGDELEEGDVAHLANEGESSFEAFDSEEDDEDDDDYGFGGDRAERMARLNPVGSKRYKRWFNLHRHSGMTYFEYNSGEDDY